MPNFFELNLTYIMVGARVPAPGAPLNNILRKCELEGFDVARC